MFDWPSLKPACVFFQGYYRISESYSYGADLMLFEVLICAALYVMTKVVFILKIEKLEKAVNDANGFFVEILEEPFDSTQNKCLQRCLRIAESALREYDGLLLLVNNLLKEPTHRVCHRYWPGNLKMLKKASSYESFRCLKKALSANSFSSRILAPDLL